MNIPAKSMEQLIEKIRHLPVERIAEVEDFVDFLQERVTAQQPMPTKRELLDFPVDHLGKWPEGLSLQRKDMYNNDER